MQLVITLLEQVYRVLILAMFPLNQFTLYVTYITAFDISFQTLLHLAHFSN